MLEQARVDPPLALSAVTLDAPRDFARAEGAAWTLATGRPLALLLAAANRDAAVFDDPDAFEPARRELGRALSFNGADADFDTPNAPPRGCVARALALALAERIVDVHMPPEPFVPADPDARTGVAAPFWVEARALPPVAPRVLEEWERRGCANCPARWTDARGVGPPAV